MKRTILILLFFSWQLYIWSQVNDKIITTSGETIICRLDSITPTHIYFSTVVRNSLVQTYMEMSMVQEYQPYILNEDYIDFSKDEPIIKYANEDFIDFSLEKSFLKKGKMKTYTTWVTLCNFTLKYKGVLYEVNDSSITLAGSIVVRDYQTKNYEMLKIHVSSIMIISTRRKKNTARGAWIGAVSGFGASLILGFAATRSLIGTGMTGAFYGIPFAIIGAGVGAIIATIPLGIPIHGDMNRYNSRKKC